MTTTTTTTVAIVATMQAAIAFGVTGTIVLILALIIRELSSVNEGYTKPNIIQRTKALTEKERARAMGKNVLVAIVPMLMIFMLIVAVRISNVLTT